MIQQTKHCQCTLTHVLLSHPQLAAAVAMGEGLSGWRNRQHVGKQAAVLAVCWPWCVFCAWRSRAHECDLVGMERAGAGLPVLLAGRGPHQPALAGVDPTLLMLWGQQVRPLYE
jgi:hypothetical protein